MVERGRGRQTLQLRRKRGKFTRIQVWKKKARRNATEERDPRISQTTEEVVEAKSPKKEIARILTWEKYEKGKREEKLGGGETG